MKVLRRFITRTEQGLLLDMARVAMYEDGRQQTGYFRSLITSDNRNSRKWLLALCNHCLAAMSVRDPASGSGTHGHDAYFIKYPTGSLSPSHLDPVPGFEHRRVNMILRMPPKGGVLTVDGVEYDLLERDAYTFSPDREWHGVSAVDEGERIVFTVGTVVNA